MAKMIRKQIYMTENQDGELKAKARELKVTEAEVVREALEVYQTYGGAEMILDSSAWLKEREFLRQSLLPTMLETLRTNSRYRQRMVLFEIGRVYLPQAGEELPLEQRRLAIALTGTVQPASWHQKEAAPLLGFMHLKGIVDTLVQRLNVPSVQFTPTTHPSLAPGRTASLPRPLLPAASP